jgi:hypothetical protein
MGAKVTIKSEPLNRFVTTKNGQKQVHYQNAELETKNMRVQLEVEIDSPQHDAGPGATRPGEGRVRKSPSAALSRLPRPTASAGRFLRANGVDGGGRDSAVPADR